jgi:hypothetical protein
MSIQTNTISVLHGVVWYGMMCVPVLGCMMEESSHHWQRATTQDVAQHEGSEAESETDPEEFWYHPNTRSVRHHCLDH